MPSIQNEGAATRYAADVDLRFTVAPFASGRDENANNHQLLRVG
jgi:hypothetical protein